MDVTSESASCSATHSVNRPESHHHSQLSVSRPDECTASTSSANTCSVSSEVSILHDEANYLSKSPKAKLYFYTGLIFFSYTVYGIGYNIWGPTWIDLISLLHSSQDQLAYGNSLFAIGYIFGSFTSSYVFDHFSRQIFIGLYLLMMAISIGLTPILANYYAFLALAVLFGIGEGGFDTGINSWILEMWLDDNGPVMQSMYFFYGLGTLLSPLICLNFLSDDNFVDSTSGVATSLRTVNTTDHSAPLSTSIRLTTNVTRLGQVGPHHHNFIFALFDREQIATAQPHSMQSNIEVSYLIISGLLSSAAVLVIGSHFVFRYRADEAATIMRLKNPDVVDVEPDTEHTGLVGGGSEGECRKYGTIHQTEADADEPVTGADAASKRKIVILVLIGSVMCCFYDGMENINFEYMTSFLVNSPLAISEAEAARLVSVMSAAYTACRGLGIFVIMKLPARFLLVIDFVLIFTGVNLLYYSMANSETGLVAGLAMLGFGTATFMPCLFSYFEAHVRLTNSLCAILSLSCALVSTVDPIIVGHLITNLPVVVLYINYASLVVVAAAFTLFELVVLGPCRARRSTATNH